MHPGSPIPEILARFRQGLAATTKFKSGLVGDVTVYLVPGKLLSEDHFGLLIVVEGRGSYSWDGLRPLNGFRLISSGIRPNDIADEVARLVNAVYEELRQPSTLLIEDSSTGE